ncbi:hypothetical protein SNEBB_002546 [Seison nebaliae]|nr:hypothetical protein SNEBB_002546 [Seison nebaliae]
MTENATAKEEHSPFTTSIMTTSVASFVQSNSTTDNDFQPTPEKRRQIDPSLSITSSDDQLSNKQSTIVMDEVRRSHLTFLQTVTTLANQCKTNSLSPTDLYQNVQQLLTAVPPLTRLIFFRSDRLQICSDFQRGSCHNGASCAFAHPTPNNQTESDGIVVVCVDFIKGKCNRESCRYFHPTAALVNYLKNKKYICIQYGQATNAPFNAPPSIGNGTNIFNNSSSANLLTSNTNLLNGIPQINPINTNSLTGTDLNYNYNLNTQLTQLLLTKDLMQPPVTLSDVFRQQQCQQQQEQSQLLLNLLQNNTNLFDLSRLLAGQQQQQPQQQHPPLLPSSQYKPSRPSFIQQQQQQQLSHHQQPQPTIDINLTNTLLQQQQQQQQQQQILNQCTNNIRSVSSTNDKLTGNQIEISGSPSINLTSYSNSQYPVNSMFNKMVNKNNNKSNNINHQNKSSNGTYSLANDTNNLTSYYENDEKQKLLSSTNSPNHHIIPAKDNNLMKMVQSSKLYSSENDHHETIAHFSSKTSQPFLKLNTTSNTTANTNNHSTNFSNSLISNIPITNTELLMNLLNEHKNLNSQLTPPSGQLFTNSSPISLPYTPSVNDNLLSIQQINTSIPVRNLDNDILSIRKRHIIETNDSTQ